MNKSLNNLIKLADKFEKKILKNSGIFEGEDPKSVIADAIFVSKDRTKNENTFLASLQNANTFFQKAIAKIPSPISIGGVVDIPSDIVDLTVSYQGSDSDDKKSAAQAEAVKNALLKDYKNHYKLTPKENINLKKLDPEYKAKLPTTLVEFPSVITF